MRFDSCRIKFCSCTKALAGPCSISSSHATSGDAPATQVSIGNRTMRDTRESQAHVGDVGRTAPTDSGRAYDPHPIIGAAVAVIVVALYGRPTHVIVTTPLLLVMTGLGVTAGYHRLFAHHSFATF